jgi:N-acetylmuramoyl-L-alanine amidase
MAGSSIIVCGQSYDVGRRVVTWQDDPTFSAYTLHRTDKPAEIYPYAPAKGLGAMAARYRERRLIGADRSLSRLQQVLRQFVVHHDGCPSSKTCFQVLHNERGLSVHFLIDNDGTIYQTLDVVDCAFQAAGVNEISVGVELANRGDAIRFPDDYHGQRDKLTCTIHGHQFLAYSYTKDQLDSMSAIGKTMARLFPNLPQTYPLAGSGDALWTAIADPREYQGWLGHYHVTQQKWDPGPFDFKSFVGTIRGRSVFPLAIGADKPDIPEDKDKAETAAESYYANNENEGEGGYFPVGPFGQSRLWHGGIHLRADRGAPLFAPFAGKVVAARVAESIAIGSRNFVLIKHELPGAGGPVTFWTLYFHLDEERGGAAADPLMRMPRWMEKARLGTSDDPVSLSIDVAAGELVGHVGEAGAPGRFEGQVHVEIFSSEEIGDRLEPGFWQPIDGSGTGRFCNDPFVIGRIDRADHGKRDGLLSRAEVLAFYRGDERRKEFRKLAVRHISEWADENDWMVQLNRARDFAGLPKPQKLRLFKEQIEPVLWWTDEIQTGAGLPSDKLVWSYHPITFILWMTDRQRGGGGANQGIQAASSYAGVAAPTSIMDDRDATEGFTDDEDAMFGDAARKLELEDLAKGYPDDDKPGKKK